MPLFPAPLPQAWIIDTPEMGNAASGTLTANSVYCYVFELLQTVTISGMRLKIGATATGTADVGIYDSGGNLLIHASSSTTLTANANPQHIAFSANITLNPGRYIMAMTPSLATDTIFRATSVGGGMMRAYNATNTGTAGVLPGTTGTLVVGNNCPSMGLEIVGGAV